MRKALLVGAGCAALLAAVLWWSQRYANPPPPSEPPSGPSVPSGQRMNAMLSQPLAAARGSGTVTGRVLRGAEPVAGAVVTATVSDTEAPLDRPCTCEDACGSTVFECSCGLATDALQALVEDRRGEAVPVARTQTAADGTFTLAGLEPGRVDVWADDPRLGTALQTRIEPGASGLELKLGDGVTFTGQVVLNGPKEPAAGAWLAALRTHPTRYFDLTAGPDGRFVLGPVPKGDYVIIAGLPGRLSAHAHAHAGEALKLPLPLPRDLGGVVTLDKKPLSGARVRLEGAHRKAEAVTDAAGTFRFAALRPGEYDLQVRHGELGARARAEPGDPVKLELKLTVRVHGTVGDESERPIAGARVSLRTDDGAQELESASDGTYAFTVLSAPEALVNVRGDGRVSAETVAVLDRSDVLLDFTLRAEGLVSGVVVDPSGAPAAGATVEVAGLGERRKASALTDSAGAFELHGLPPGDYTLRATHNDFGPGEAEVRSPSPRAKLQLTKGLTVTGQVVTRAGKSVAAQVWLEGADFGKDHVTTSGADGRFTLNGVEEGTGTLQVETAEPPPRKGTKVIEVSASHRNDVRVELDEVLSISGVLLGTGGQPLKGEWVFANARDISAPSSSALTDEAGEFQIDGLSPGDYEVSASADEAYARASARAGDTAVKLQLPPTATVHGRAVGPAGEPIGSFRVDRELFEGDTGEFELHLQPRDDGREHELQISAEGYLPVKRKVRLTRPERIELGDVVLGVGADLEVRVSDAQGRPVPRATLSSSARRSRTSAETGPDGIAHVRGVSAGSTLTVEHPRYVPQELVIGAGEKSRSVVLQLGATLRIGVKTSAGRPARAVIMASNLGQGGQSRIEPAGEDGELLLEGLSPGRWQVTANLRDRGARLVTGDVIDLAGDIEQRLDLKLPPLSVTLELAAVLPPGRFTEGAAVLISPKLAEPGSRDGAEALWGASLAEATMDAERPGRFLFETVSPGAYRLLVRLTTSDEKTVWCATSIEVAAAPARQTVRASSLAPL